MTARTVLRKAAIARGRDGRWKVTVVVVNPVLRQRRKIAVYRASLEEAKQQLSRWGVL